ncbi:MAG: hypothetical protein H0X24_00350 [Ktedonobacterales bacterium]|nr:hypothetical protein [Ktedonobacterales bacterium]
MWLKVCLVVSLLIAGVGIVSQLSPTALPQTQSAMGMMGMMGTMQPARFPVPGGEVGGTLTLLPSAATYQQAGGQFAGKLADVQARLLNPQFFQVAGMWDGSTYHFDVQGYPAGKGVRIAMITFGYNLSAHTELVAVGAATSLFMNKKLPAESSQQKTQSIAPNACVQVGKISPQLSCGGGGGGSSLPYTTFNMETYFTDPVYIDLADVTDSIGCYYSASGRYVTGCSGWDNRYWYSTDGWYEVSHSSYMQYVNSGHAMESTTDHFRNKPFCLLNWTDVYMHPNEAHLLYDGSGYGNESTGQTGNCAGLISVQTAWWNS